jgi:hypothetical protein
MRAIIMAQGSQARLRSVLGEQPKQLIELGGEPLIGRTLRYLDGRGAVTVYRHPGNAAWNAFDLQRIGTGREIYTSLSLPGLCVVDGIGQALAHHAAHWPQEKLLVLLGDVAWSRPTLEALVTDPRPLVFCGWSPVTGSLGEVYGAAVAPHVLPLLSRACADHVAECRRIPYEGPQPGHLRRVLWALTSDSYRIEGTWRVPPSCWLEADGLTMDVDTPADLAELRLLEPELCKEK